MLLGTYFSLQALSRTGYALVPLLAVTLLTLLLSVGAGLLVARRTHLDEPTAALGLIAGGSAGIFAAADDLDADARAVAVLQYVRVILVVATALLLVRFVLVPHHGTYAVVGAKEIEAFGSLHGYGFTIGLALLGAAIQTRLRIPAGVAGPAVLTALGGAIGLYNDLQPPKTVHDSTALPNGGEREMLALHARDRERRNRAGVAVVGVMLLVCAVVLAVLAVSHHTRHVVR